MIFISEKLSKCKLVRTAKGKKNQEKFKRTRPHLSWKTHFTRSQLKSGIRFLLQKHQVSIPLQNQCTHRQLEFHNDFKVKLMQLRSFIVPK